MESIILAAGYSSRFNFENNSYQKFFLPFERSNILNYVIVGMLKAGIEKINIVIDDKTDITQITESCNDFLEKIGFNLKILSLNFIRNNYSERENGYSFYLGLKEISSEMFVLAMADHIFTDNVFLHLIKNFNNRDIVLATDPMKIQGVYDLDDCTKVYGDNLEIKEMGKDLSKYNRLDMGVFTMKTNSIREISEVVEKKRKKFGVSDVVISAINSNLKVGYFDFPNTIWLDVDNHFEYSKLNKLFNSSSKFHPFNLDFIREKL